MPPNQESKRYRSTLSSLSPPRNQAREEHHDHPPNDSQHGMQASVPSSLMFSDEANMWELLRLLKPSLEDKNKYKSTQGLKTIYCHAIEFCEKLKPDGAPFADSAQFLMNVGKQRSQFIEVLGKAVDKNANNDDRMALLKHSMCLCSGINLVMNIL
jgi:hypothetical protein